VSDAERSGTCADCGSPLARGQRYCLGCGERAAPRSPQLLELLARTRAGASEEPPRDQGRPAPGLPSAEQRIRRRRIPTLAPAIERVSELRPPSRGVSALLVLAFLGFGVLLGNVASSRVEDSLAASARPHYKLLLPAASTAPAESAEAASAEPPEASAEPTPEAAAEEPAPVPVRSTSETSKSAGGSQGEKGANGKTTSPAANGPATKLPAFKHVFEIVLSGEPYAATFGPESAAPYLAHTLEKHGELLVRYYAVAHQQLANGVALLSGQGPTPATAANCPLYSDLVPASVGAEGQVLGEGCVYPATTETLPGQLSAKHLTARAYVQGIDEAGATPTACAHPALGQPDPSAGQAPTQAYATFRDPFVYFHSLIDTPACASDDVGLASLDADLSSAKRTPSFSYIVPDRCHDGSPGPCPGGGAGGLPAADELLKQLVPKILRSKAYKQGGLLVITTDEAPSSGEFADSSSCCGQPRFPNLSPATGAAAVAPEGGGQVGALLLSPYVKGGVLNQEPYSHFSLLRTVEGIFGVKPLGYAGGAHVGSLEPSLFLAKPQGK
jgi:phosphatidylinositol-3-phosphatase